MISKSDNISFEQFSEFVQKINLPLGRYNKWPNVTLEGIAKKLFAEFNEKENVLIIKNEKSILLVCKIDLLEWDSNFFGYNCAKITILNTSTEHIGYHRELLLQSFSDYLDSFIHENNIRFISADVNSWNNEGNELLQKSGFKYILSWLDGFIPTDKLSEKIILPDNHSIGILKENEIPYFQQLSEEQYFNGGRFFFDPNFSDSDTKKLYSNLVRNSVSNNDINIVYKLEGKPIGLFICKKTVDYKEFSNIGVVQLRYLLVDQKYRNQKIGKHLFNATLHYLKDKAEIITTGLEVHNITSLNLHSRLDFTFNYTHNAFHKWI